MVPDVLRCKTCGNAFIDNGNYTRKICPRCDMSYEDTAGETESGGAWAPMPREQVKYNKIRNAQMAEYAANLKELTASYMRCDEFITSLQEPRAGTLMSGMQARTTHDFANLFNLANIGKYYLCIMLKETAGIYKDLGRIKPGDDPWNLGGKA